MMEGGDLEAQKSACNQIKACTKRIQHLLQQMLQLSRVDLERTQITLQSVDLKSVVVTQIQQLYSLANRANINLSLNAKRVPQVQAMLRDLPVLVSNLLENAILYTPDGGEVRVTLRTQQGQVLMEIEDSGPGIPKDQYERVFERFYRVLGSDKPGSGLGLAIAREVMNANGGTIELGTSKDLGGLSVRCRFKCADDKSLTA
jgi:two-component system OmpR family sensor kinase